MAANSGKEIIALLETLDHCDYSPLTGRGRFAGLLNLQQVIFTQYGTVYHPCLHRGKVEASHTFFASRYFWPRAGYFAIPARSTE
jgi:hypothetical protein